MASSNSLPISARRFPSEFSSEEYVPLNTLSPNDTTSSPPGPESLNAPLTDEGSSTTALLHEHSTLHADVNRSKTTLVSSDEGFADPGGIPQISEDPSHQCQPGPRSTFGPPTTPNLFDLKDWLWEFASAFFSIACSLSIVGVLIAFQNKSMSSWQFMLGMTLNTLVSILSTLSRTALLVPIASCVSQLKWIHFLNSTHNLRELQLFDDASRGPWGSLTLIWKLHFTTKLANWGSFITILSLAMGAFTQQLLSYPSRQQDSPDAVLYLGQEYQADTISPGDLEMERAIIRGLYNTGRAFPFKCPNGHCKWEKVTTLAVCSTCRNVTSDSTNPLVCGYDTCNYTTSSGLFVSVNLPRDPNGYLRGLPQFNTSANANNPIDHFKSVSSTIVELAMLKRRDFPMLYDIIECEMRWCARVISNTTVLDGNFIPGVSEDFSLSEIAPFNNWLRFSITENYTSFPGNRTFGIERNVQSVISIYLANLFSHERFIWLYNGLSRSENLVETVASISHSMTDALGIGPSAKKAEGKATEQYIRVNWVWISLPLANVSMGLAFLICTLVYTKRKGAIAWKSSSIALLFTEMHGWNGTDLRATASRNLEKRSEGMRGLLVPNKMEAQQFSRMDG